MRWSARTRLNGVKVSAAGLLGALLRHGHNTDGWELAVVTSLVIRLVQISGIREGIRELRSDMKLLTGKVYDMMAQK